MRGLVSVPSHNNISIVPHLPRICPFFPKKFLLERNRSLFYHRQCQEIMLNTHRWRDTRPRWCFSPGRPSGNWTKTIPWLSLFTSHHPCCAGVPFLTQPCLTNVCLCPSEREFASSLEGFWRALCSYLRVCRCAVVCKLLVVHRAYLCLVCLKSWSITHLLHGSQVTKGPQLVGEKPGVGWSHHGLDVKVESNSSVWKHKAVPLTHIIY